MFGETIQPAPKKCAIYVRVSSDPFAEGHSTNRQLDNCRRFCQAREWQVTDTFEDIDESAYKRNTRPGLEQLLNALSSGRFDTIVVWRLDRLVRRNDDFERIWALCERHGIALASVTEPVDTTSGVGIAVMRMLVTFAGLESTIKSERLKAKNLEDARRGLPQPGGIRSFGYDKDMHIIDEEAAVIREAAQRIFNGESVVHIAQDLANRGVVGKRGAPMSAAGLRGILCNHTIAGERSYHGTYMGTGQWDPIIDSATGAQLRFALVGSRGGRQRRRDTPALIAGLLRCAICGSTLNSKGTPRRYGCPTATGCSKTNSIHGEHTDRWVSELVLWRLEQRWPKNARTPTLANDTSQHHIETLNWATQAAKRLNIARYIDGTISHLEYVAARAELETRIGKRLHETSNYVPPPVIPANFDPRHARNHFHTLTRPQQQGVIELEIDHIIVTPGSRHTWDPARLTPVYWQELPRNKAHLPIPEFGIGKTMSQHEQNPTLQHAALYRLHIDEGRTLNEIAALANCKRQTVARYLQLHNIDTPNQHTDTFGRTPIDRDTLEQLYITEQRSQTEIQRLLATSHMRVSRNLENYRIPIRPEQNHRHAPYAVLDMLYTDPLVTSTLDRHGVEQRPQAGSLAIRFGTPQPTNPALIADLYLHAGLSTRQIELVTGTSQRTILRHLHAQRDYPLRNHRHVTSPATNRYRTAARTQ